MERTASLSQILDGACGSLFVTEEAPKPETKKKKRTVSNGTITGNGPPISSTGKLHVWVLTYVRDHVCILPACNISFFVGGGEV